MTAEKKWNVDRLRSLIGESETQILEFKSAKDMDRRANKQGEISKDVSAMANAIGGIIIYGIAEEKGVATALDGTTDPAINSDWFQQIITSNIQPSIQGVSVERVALEGGAFAFVVTIPQATTYAPHQNTASRRYHIRRDAVTFELLDYEIRDLMQRSSRPELECHVGFTPSFEKGPEEPELYTMRVAVETRSANPVFFARISVAVAHEMDPQVISGHVAQESTTHTRHNGVLHPMRYYEINVVSPPQLPLFRESFPTLFEAKVRIPFRSSNLVTWQLECPGFEGRGWVGVVRGDDQPIYERVGPREIKNSLERLRR